MEPEGGSNMSASNATSSSDRSLLEHDPNGAKLWAIQSGRRTRYLVEQGTCSWEFSLLWSAISKYDRCARKGGIVK
jgi:hypothetical protein